MLTLDSGVDYRMRNMVDLAPMQCFHTPHNEGSADLGSYISSDFLASETQTLLMKIFEQMTSHRVREPIPETLDVNGHALTVPLASEGVAWFSFDSLCKKDYGAGDFLALCQHYHTIIVSNIPRMELHDKNAARRFIVFLDAVYDKRVSA